MTTDDKLKVLEENFKIIINEVGRQIKNLRADVEWLKKQYLKK